MEPRSTPENAQPTQAGENPTVNAPGAQVADYGNVTGGSESQPQQDEGTETRQGNSSIPMDNEDTIGNP